MHVPLRHEAVRDCMPTLFELLREEPDLTVRVVLGPFIFVYSTLLGWQRTHGTLPNECRSCGWQVFMDSNSCRTKIKLLPAALLKVRSRGINLNQKNIRNEAGSYV